MCRSVRWYAALLLAVSAAQGTMAQQGQGANAAANDATVVLRRGPLSRVPGESVEYLTAPPERFPKDLLPAGATVRAASVSPSLTVVVAAMPATDTFEFTKYQWKLEDLGWTSSGFSRFGFTQSNVPGGRDAPPVELCRNGEFAQITLATVSSGARFVRIGIGPDPRRSCAPTGMRSFSDVALPMLELPPGIRYSGGGGGGGLDDTQARTRIETDMSSEALAMNFVGQMKAIGWRLESGPTGDVAMTVARMSHTSRSGDPVTAIVLVTALTGTPFVDAVVRVVRNKPSR